MEIERKFTIKTLPEHLAQYPAIHMEQGYLNTNPVVRVRKENEDFVLTYKGKGLLAREEYNLPLNKESYAHLKEKCDGNIITKTRYRIPLPNPVFAASCPKELIPETLTIELDIFEPPFAPLILAEVEFDSLEAARAFLPPDWFLEDVTMDKAYHNSTLSRKTL